jgi:uncharacterized protein (DUF305 family)
MKKILVFSVLVLLFAACKNSGKKVTREGSESIEAGDSVIRNQQNPMREMHDAMSSSMKQMKNVSPTGDPDQDFVLIMKPHHQGAIDMAKAELAGGKDSIMKAKAQMIMDAQQSEIMKFDEFIRNNKPSGNSDYGQKAMGMMTEMKDIKMESSSLDAMFASMMIPHHKDAVNMAREYLKVGKDEAIRTIANNIISSQQKEITEFEQWLAAHK